MVQPLGPLPLDRDVGHAEEVLASETKSTLCRGRERAKKNHTQQPGNGKAAERPGGGMECRKRNEGRVEGKAGAGSTPQQQSYAQPALGTPNSRASSESHFTLHMSVMTLFSNFCSKQVQA